MSTRDALIAAMNPRAGGAWSPAAQALHLALHDMQAAMPDGWSMGYAVCDDDSAHNPNNCVLFSEELRGHIRAGLARSLAKAANDDDRDDLTAIPTDGEHVLIVLTHAETGARLRRWIDRAELVTAFAAAGSAAQKRAVVRARIDAAIADAAPRVQRRRVTRP